MIKIKQAVVVEGKYDKIKLSSLLDTLIIETEGFRIFRDREKLDLLRSLAKTRGLVILTDSDSAGFKIRSYLGSCIREGEVVNAYIPDILGKERRKTAASAEGTLGVEGMPVRVIVEALERAGVMSDYTEPDARRIQKLDLYEDGFYGTPDAKERRLRLLKRLGLPQRLSANAMPGILSAMLTYEEYKTCVAELNAETS